LAFLSSYLLLLSIVGLALNLIFLCSLALTTKQPKFVPNAFVGREESASHNESLAFVGKS